MSQTTYTMEQLQALQAAIAQGTLRVKYENKEIWYRSLDEMKRIENDMMVALGVKPKPKKNMYPAFNSGL